MTKYKIGDTVILTDSGFCYTTYRAWTGIPLGYKLEEYYKMLPDTPYMIMSEGVHGNCGDRMVSVASEDMVEKGKVFIIGTEGIRPIKYMKTYKAYNELNS